MAIPKVEVKTTRTRPSPPTSTVPGEGRVSEDEMSRNAPRADRSAAQFTKPQSEHFGG